MAALPTANPADVGTIADIMRTSYETINGASVQLDRDRTLYLPGALFVGGWPENGQIKPVILTPEEFRMRLIKQDKPGYEVVLGRRIERYGLIAQVREVTGTHEPTLQDPIARRSVVYSQLFWDGTRWWITGQVWQRETPTTPIHESWIGTWEDITR